VALTFQEVVQNTGAHIKHLNKGVTVCLSFKCVYILLSIRTPGLL